MKLDARQIAGLLRDPSRCRVVLLYGEDEGQIREHARSFVKAVAGSLDDPFRVAELDREGWPHLTAEITSMAMTGGRRVVRLRDVSDAVLAPLQAALKSKGEALIVIEAPGLAKGKLRSFAETAADAAAIACYPEEGRALEETIRRMLADGGVSADAEAITWLADATGGDRSVVRGEVEKLVLLAGAGGRLDLEQVRACAGDGGGAGADDGLVAALRGDVAGSDAAIDAAMNEGVAGIQLLRMALNQLQRLHVARLRMKGGMSASDAVRSLRPPVFFKAVGAMTASLTLWSEEALLRALEECRQVEIACKQTGSRPELLARRFVASLARTARLRASS